MFDLMLKFEDSGKVRVRMVEDGRVKFMTKQELKDLIDSYDVLEPENDFDNIIDSGKF